MQRSIALHDFYANNPLRFHHIMLAAKEPDIGGVICPTVRDGDYMIVLDANP